MTIDFYDWFAGLATIGGFAYFLLGFGSAYLYQCVKAKIRHREVSIPWHLAGIVIGIVAILITTVQASTAYNTAKETAAEVQQCQKEFNQALRDRSRIAAENDTISQEQRRILFNWIHDLIFPPEPYIGMDVDDPRRRAYSYSLTIDTEHALQTSLHRQDELQKEREASPLPDPTCGK